MTQLTGGGAPMLGEPLPIELANTTYAVRGRPQDGLRTSEQLAVWLRDVRARLPVTLTDADLRTVTDADLAVARELRVVVRSMADAIVQDRAVDPDLVAALNRQVRRAPRWRELTLAPDPRAEVRSEARPVTAALAALAEEAVELFAGPAHHELHACPGPGCVLYFLRNHPRREWCSPVCGNRARAARHYAKTKRAG